MLEQAAQALKSAPAGTVIEIGGHTDNRGNSAANQRLSQQRAESVRHFLINKGVNANSIAAKGYGDSSPIAGNDSEEGRFRNRRIEFKEGR
jgi:OOP family OmpA-OmpF porin